MLKIENVSFAGVEPAVRGMRNPMNSWDKSDSKWGPFETPSTYDCWRFNVGENDHDLMSRLANGGPVHAKYRRMMVVYLDITAPLYWWKEFDTYKVGTVANSCSTMHKIHSKEFTEDDFSWEHLEEVPEPSDVAQAITDHTLTVLNYFRRRYLETKDKRFWWGMIQTLPSSYNQRRTVMLSYEVLVNIYRWRRDHKLDEWHTFCDWIESLPYSDIITGEVQNEQGK